MNINLGTPITDFTGQPLPQTAVGIRSKDDLTLGVAIVSSLGTTLPNEKSVPSEEKMKRYGLAIRLLHKDELDLSIEECAMIKNCCDKMYPAMIYGQIDRILEGKDTGITVKQPKTENDPNRVPIEKENTV